MLPPLQGWRQFETKWTFFKEEKLHTIAQLQSMLCDDILPHEMAMRRMRKLPKEAALPQLRVRDLKRLGTTDAAVLSIEQESLFKVKNLLPKAEARRVEREAVGISDSVEARQPKQPPAFDAALVGKRIEVLWPYKLDGKTTKIWASGTIKRVAGGLTDTRSSRAKAILPCGFVLWGWDADPEYDEREGQEWLQLHPKKWNADAQYVWRWDPRELQVSARRAQLPRTPCLDDVDPHTNLSDEEYIPSDDENDA